MRYIHTLLLTTLILTGCPKPNQDCTCDTGTNESSPEPDTTSPCKDVSTPPKNPSLRVKVGQDWGEVSCGGIKLKVNKLDTDNEWVYLAYEFDSEVGYSGKMPYAGKKANRASLYFDSRKMFIYVDDCRESECDVVCQPLVEEN